MKVNEVYSKKMELREEVAKEAIAEGFRPEDMAEVLSVRDEDFVDVSFDELMEELNSYLPKEEDA